MTDIDRRSGNLRKNREDDEDYNDSPSHQSHEEVSEKNYAKIYKGRDEVIQIKGIILKETDSTVLIKFKTTSQPELRQEWFPVSQVKSIHRFPGKLSKIIVSAWIASKKDITL